MSKRKDNTILIIFMLILSTFTYYYALRQMPHTLADYNGHTYVYLPKFLTGNWLEGWETVPYFMWHVSVIFLYKILYIPLEVSAAVISCIFACAAYLVTYRMIQKVIEALSLAESSAKAAFIAFGLSMVQSFYLPWFDVGERYMGVYSINPVHNPTQMCVKVFSLLCFALVYDILETIQTPDRKGVFFKVEKGLKKYYFLLALFLFLSTLAKPTFAQMFIPAVGFLMLYQWLKKLLTKDGSAKEYFRHCLSMLYCSIPSLLYISLQFVDYYIAGGNNNSDTSVVITGWLEVWRLFSENIAVSVLVSMAFPLFVILIDLRYFLTSTMGKLALTAYGVSFLEAALLGEQGAKFSHGNFLWALTSGMLLVWITCVLRLFALDHLGTSTKLQKILVDCAWALFYIHLIFGIIFMI